MTIGGGKFELHTYKDNCYCIKNQKIRIISTDVSFSLAFDYHCTCMNLECLEETEQQTRVGVGLVRGSGALRQLNKIRMQIVGGLCVFSLLLSRQLCWIGIQWRADFTHLL